MVTGTRLKKGRGPRRASLISSVQEAVRQSVQAVIGCSALPDEVRKVVQLCMIGVSPTGKEDPKGLLRSLSDSTINTVATRLKKMGADPVLGKVSQLFLMEWCHRHGHLDADWTWQWDAKNEGHVRFFSKEPLDRLFEHVDKMC